MNVIVFEDAACNRLFPVTIGRASFDVTCASWQLADWLDELAAGGSIRALVRPHLRALLQLDRPGLCQPPSTSETWTLVINGRAVPSVSNIARIRSFASEERAGLVRGQDGTLGCALVRTADLPGDEIGLTGSIEQLSEKATDEGAATHGPDSVKLFVYPHDLVRENLECFDENINHRLNSKEYREIADGVFIQGEVTLSDYVVTNTSDGPIIIEDGSVIGPFSFLRGPVFIGPNCRINEHAAIKDQVSLAHTIKIGGEVEGSVIEAWSNKQHRGFLGHSYLGSWINLGAGTCNSDLKNTYGEVKMNYAGERVATGMQFVGCIIGDYAKSAINTSIFTGKVIGAGSMLYGFVTTNVPSFVNYARSFGQTTESPPAVLELTQRRMFARRNVEQRPEDIQLIYEMYELTQIERQISEEPLVL